MMIQGFTSSASRGCANSLLPGAVYQAHAIHAMPRHATIMPQ